MKCFGFPVRFYKTSSGHYQASIEVSPDVSFIRNSDPGLGGLWVLSVWNQVAGVQFGASLNLRRDYIRGRLLEIRARLDKAAAVAVAAKEES